MQEREQIWAYYDRLIDETFGKDGRMKILEALSDVPNGFCGVEMYHKTYPALLAAQGVEPTRTYEDEFGLPMDDGREAATPEQRQAIRDALTAAGFPLG